MDVFSGIGYAILSAAIPLIIASIVKALKNLHPERELTFKLRSQARLPAMDLGSKANLLELKWAGQTVESLVVSRWRLTNSGSQPIKREDIDEKISIKIPEYDFLGASVFKGDPVDLENRVKNSLTNTSVGFDISPLLWNTKESVDFTVVTKKPIADIHKVSVESRIVSGAVKVVDETQPDRRQYEKQQRFLFLAMGFASAIAAAVGMVLALTLR